MNLAALEQEYERLKALLGQKQAALAEHQAALVESEEARRRLEMIVVQLNHEKLGAHEMAGDMRITPLRTCGHTNFEPSSRL
jgi:chromosome segregation ATPase